MSYTNTEQVRYHLANSFPTHESVRDQLFKLEGTDNKSFYRGAVEEESIVVKSRQSNELLRTILTLESSASLLSTSPLVEGSVVVASDSSLGTIYVENRDYIVDYQDGLLSLKSGGDLSAGSQITVWYQPYTVYIAGSDFQVVTDIGEIRRMSGGDIADGESVYLDYSTVDPCYTEQMLTNAVAEANGLIERQIDPDGRFGADPALHTAATYRALELICHACASRELSSGRNEDRVALAWMKLADVFALRSANLLASFRAPLTGPTNPTHS